VFKDLKSTSTVEYPRHGIDKTSPVDVALVMVVLAKADIAPNTGTFASSLASTTGIDNADVFAPRVTAEPPT